MKDKSGFVDDFRLASVSPDRIKQECLASLVMTGLLTYLLLIHRSAELSFPILLPFLIEGCLLISCGPDCNDVIVCLTKLLYSGTLRHLQSKISRIL